MVHSTAGWVENSPPLSCPYSQNMSLHNHYSPYPQRRERLLNLHELRTGNGEVDGVDAMSAPPDAQAENEQPDALHESPTHE